MQPNLRIAGESTKPIPRRFVLTIESLKAFVQSDPGRDKMGYDLKSPGLAFRRRASGSAAFYYIRRIGPKVRKHHLGDWGEITIDKARDRVAKLNGIKADELDPVAEVQRRHRETEADRLTLRELWSDFKADKLSTAKASTLENYKSYMEGAALKDWLDQPVKSITGDMVFRRHRKLGEESGKAYANAAMRVLRAVFNFGVAVQSEIVKKNPTAALKKRWYAIPRRTTKIPDDKLGDWFKALTSMRSAVKTSAEDARNSVSIPDDTARLGADFLEFTLFTGLRRNEASQLQWDRVDLDKKTVTVIDTKNGKPLVLPLSEHLATLLGRRRKEAGKSAWVFPSPGRKGTAFFAEPRYAIDRLTALSGITHSVHDLRRTFITAATRLVPHAVVKTLVNHTAKSDDITLDYVTLDVEELRPHVEKIAAFFQSHASPGKKKVT